MLRDKDYYAAYISIQVSWSAFFMRACRPFPPIFRKERANLSEGEPLARMNSRSPASRCFDRPRRHNPCFAFCISFRMPILYASRLGAPSSGKNHMLLCMP